MCVRLGDGLAYVCKLVSPCGTYPVASFFIQTHDGHFCCCKLSGKDLRRLLT